MPKFNHFDVLAPLFDRSIAPDAKTRYTRIAGLPVSGNLLDVGGGTGRISHPLLPMVNKIVIVDSSIGMLTRASSKTGLHILCSESETLPFSAASFERVIMVDAFHHVSNHQNTAHELWRVLKAGGRIVIEEPDIRTVPVKVMAVVEKLALMRSHLRTPQEIADLFGYSNAIVNIEYENNTAWIVIDKQA
jgi:demethylmenaquinone methyltransferase/2-methoxy-6-polyprenyl-1,4-benzoquinol methylase